MTIDKVYGKFFWTAEKYAKRCLLGKTVLYNYLIDFLCILNVLLIY